MGSTVQLIDLFGAVALLLWGLRLIKTGILRAFGAELRQWIGRGTGNRVSAAFWGFMATLGLQSSTATAVIIASFTARDLVKPRMAQAMMLGANLGTAVVAFFLSADLSWLASALIFIGVVTHNLSESRRPRYLGRALLGLGLMLLALQLLGAVTAPLRQSATIVTVLSALGDAPVLAVLVAAGLAVVGSSSLAVVVLVMMLAISGVVGPELALYLVAGANLGGAIPPYLAVQAEGLRAKRLTLANILVRATGAVAVILCAAPLSEAISRMDLAPGQMVAAAHIAFNLTLLVVFLPLIGPLTRLSLRLLPDRPQQDRSAPSYLDDSLLALPEMALAVAAREALRLGDLVGRMLERSLDSLRQCDEAPAKEVDQLEHDVDRLHETIKLYVARLNRQEMTPDEARRANEVISYVINLEHIGDIIDSGIADCAVKKARKKLSFSPQGLQEITDFFTHTRENIALAQATFLSRDPNLARRLMDRKIISRKLEAASAEHHIDRVRAGRHDTIETSTIHLDLLRDLKRVNSHLASVAHPIMEELGLLQESRLTAAAPEAAARKPHPMAGQNISPA